MGPLLGLGFVRSHPDKLDFGSASCSAVGNLGMLHCRTRLPEHAAPPRVQAALIMLTIILGYLYATKGERVCAAANIAFTTESTRLH